MKQRKPVPAASVFAMLPINVRTRVEELIASLSKTLGGSLDAVVAYGSAVRGGYDANTSDVDVVLLLKADSPELLESIGPALRLARAAARVETIILTSDEVKRAADVFPLLYADIRACHSVLCARRSSFCLRDHDPTRSSPGPLFLS